MSEQEMKKAGELEDSLGLGRSEISEVTITEYRKNQIVRMGECVIGLGMVGVAVGMRKKLPTWLSVSMGVVGAGMTIYNGRNLVMNFKQDGKLIREAIKMKKAEEKKVRDERKKKPETPPVSQEKKEEQPSPAQNQKPEAKKAPASNGNNNASNGNPVVATSANPAPEPKSPAVNSKPVENSKLNGSIHNGKEVALKRTNVSLELHTQEANVTESEQKEGEEIIATIVEAEAQVESSPVEATIISTEAIPIEENGREAVR